MELLKTGIDSLPENYTEQAPGENKKIKRISAIEQHC